MHGLTPPRLSDGQRRRLERRLAHRQDNFADVQLPALLDVPGMISPSECRYLYWLVAETYTGCGAIVEIGSWLGRSTIHLAAGLRDAACGGTLHCFDRFRWRYDHRSTAPLKLKPGDDFRPYFEKNVRPVCPDVVVSRTEIREISWDGGPVEILFLDAPKRLPEISATLAAFSPWLIPHAGIIVMQDFCYFAAFELAAVVSMMAQDLELLHVVDAGSTVGLRVRRSLDYHRSQPLGWNFRNWSEQQALGNWNRVMSLLPPWSRRRLEPGLGMLLYDMGHVEAGCRHVRALRDRPGHLEIWRRRLRTSLYDRYKPLFHAAGARRSLRQTAACAFHPEVRRGWTRRWRQRWKGVAQRLAKGRRRAGKCASKCRRFLRGAMRGPWNVQNHCV